MRRMSRMGTAVLLVALAACNTNEYVYRPAVNTSAVVAGKPAANYALPPELPRGDMRLATMGLAEITPVGQSDVTMPAIHLREVVVDNSDRPWRLDTREQRIILANGSESRAAFATADGPGGAPPIVDVAPGGQRTIDLFFPLPAGIGGEDELPRFDVVWNVQTDARVVTERTPFERLTLVPPPRYGWADSYYYYDPLYPNHAFYGIAPMPRVYYDRPITIQRPVQHAPPAR
jgi:hypothetical protein